jgi:hypothetical protein
LTPKQNLANY